MTTKKTKLSDNDIVLSRAEQHELRGLLAELYFPAKAHGPVPMQKDYWPEVWELYHKWHSRLDVTEEEVNDIATRAYNRATYGNEDGERKNDEK